MEMRNDVAATLFNLPTYSAQHIRAFRRHPDRTAFSWDGGSMSYGTANRMIGGMQAVFAGLGFSPGSCVSLLSSNRADAWCAGTAALASRFMTTWLHPLGALADQIHQIEDSGARVLIVDPEAFATRGEELMALASGLETIFTLGPASFGIDLLAEVERVGAYSPRCLGEPEDVATLYYTGGTTGKPKGVFRRNRQMANMAAASLVNFELPAIPRYLAASPISHVASAKLLPTWIRGGSVHLLKSFDAGKVLAAIEKERINLALFVPTMVYALLEHPQLETTDTSSLELMLYGAAPMSPTRLEEALGRFGQIFSQLYGQSECYPITVLSRADHDLARPERLFSCGFPATGCDIRLIGDDGAEVAPGEAGEICVRSTQAMSGYWKQPEQTEAVIQDGWLHTGDVAKQDDEGFLYIVDRKKDMIVSGGFNIYPREVEDVLSSHPDVSSVAIIGVPDEKWGEAVLAVVVPREGRAVAPEALQDWVRQHKGSLMTPKSVEFVSELPMTPIGKIDKKAVRSRFWKGRERQVG